jgi:hypothetical protein
MKANPLLAQLRAAFPPVPISAAGAFEQRGRLYCDAVDYEAQMDGKTWEQLDPQFFARRSDGLSFLGTSYIIDVLPLYLHLMIVFKPTSPVPETLLPMLTKPEPGHYWPAHLHDIVTKHFEELTTALSAEQSRAIAATLQHFIEEATPYAKAAAQCALERYWKRFLDDSWR